MLAEQVEGRTISMRVHIKLVPRPGLSELGDGTEANDIGRGLLKEVMTVLAMAADREGFDVEVDVQSLVY